MMGSLGPQRGREGFRVRAGKARGRLEGLGFTVRRGVGLGLGLGSPGVPWGPPIMIGSLDLDPLRGSIFHDCFKCETRLIFCLISGGILAWCCIHVRP